MISPIEKIAFWDVGLILGVAIMHDMHVATLQLCKSSILSVLWFRNFRDERGEKGLKRYYFQIDKGGYAAVALGMRGQEQGLLTLMLSVIC